MAGESVNNSAPEELYEARDGAENPQYTGSGSFEEWQADAAARQRAATHLTEHVQPVGFDTYGEWIK